MDKLNKRNNIFEATYGNDPDAKWRIGKTQDNAESETADTVGNENAGFSGSEDRTAETVTSIKKAPKPEDGANGLGADTVALNGISFTPRGKERINYSRKPYESFDFVRLEENDDYVNENSPFSEYPLTDKAGVRNDMYGEPEMHSGINRDMPEGTLISLPVDVLYKDSGNDIDHGNWIELEDNEGNILSFQHLKEVGDFNPGDKIKASTPVARSGKKGNRETLREEYYSPDGRNITEIYWRNSKKKPAEAPVKNEAKPEKDNILEWAYKNSMAGINQFNKGVFSTLVHYLPTELLGKYDFVSGLNNCYSNLYDNTKAIADSSSQSRGKGWKTAGNVLQEAVSFLPDMVLAMMSMGASTAGSSLSAVGKTNIMENVYNITKKHQRILYFGVHFCKIPGTTMKKPKVKGQASLRHQLWHLQNRC